MTMREPSSSASTTWGVARASSAPVTLIGGDLDVVTMLNEVLLKAESTRLGVELGGDRVVGHGQESCLEGEVLAQFTRHLALGQAFTEALLR